MSALGPKRTPLRSLQARARPRLAVRLHLNSDAVDGLFGTVENPSKWLRRHVHDQASAAVPALDCLHDISVWRQFSTIRSKIVYRSLHLVEHEYRWPPIDDGWALRRLALRL